MKPLELTGVRALVDAQAITHVELVATRDGLRIDLNQSFTVSNRLKQPRFFAKADTAFSWLRNMGVTTVDRIDLTDWQQVE